MTNLNELASRVEAARGETFTERCRRMLTEQSNQQQFTISRVGLETLVQDSERYGELNAKLVREQLASDEYYERTRVRTLEEQVADVAEKYPGSVLSDPFDEFGRRILTVSGVKRSPRIWKNRLATVYFIVGKDFTSAYSQPVRFFTSDDDTLLKHGGQTFQVIQAQKPMLGKWEWLWRVTEPNWRHTLLQHVAVASHRFTFGSYEEWEALRARAAGEE